MEYKGLLNRIKELKPVCKLNLSPDTAMSITTPRNLEIRQLIKVSNFSFSELRRIFYLLYHFVRSRFKSELNSLRTDLEGEKLKNGFRNKMSDLSLLGNTSKNSPEVTILFAQTLLFIVEKYREIRTDRLHVAIASLIMGVENLEILDTPGKKLSNVFQLFLGSRD